MMIDVMMNGEFVAGCLFVIMLFVSVLLRMGALLLSVESVVR